jgi:hypothetical protein
MEFNTHQAHRPGPFSNLVPVGKRDRIQAWRDPVPGERTNERTNKVSERRPTSKRKKHPPKVDAFERQHLLLENAPIVRRPAGYP